MVLRGQALLEDKGKLGAPFCFELCLFFCFIERMLHSFCVSMFCWENKLFGIWLCTFSGCKLSPALLSQGPAWLHWNSSQPWSESIVLYFSEYLGKQVSNVTDMAHLCYSGVTHGSACLTLDLLTVLCLHNIACHFPGIQAVNE